MMAILLNNMLWEEDIARQRAPLNNNVFANLCQTATASKCKDSVSDLLFDVVALGCYIGPCLRCTPGRIRMQLSTESYRRMQQGQVSASEWNSCNVERRQCGKVLKASSLGRSWQMSMTYTIRQW
jgi:hypothetical protein